MKRRFITILSLFLLAIYSLTGCSFSSVEDLVRPPKLSGENAQLQEALEKAEGGKIGIDINMQYVQNGEYERTSYIFYDLNGDKKEEVIIFYSLKENKDLILMRVFYQTNGKWQTKDSFEGSGSGVYSVEFADLNNDGCYGIVVIWDVYEHKNKMLSVFSVTSNENNMEIKSIATEPCNTVNCVDVNGDEAIELFITYIDFSDTSSKAFARILKLDQDGKIYCLNELQLDPSIIEYSSIKIEEATDDKPVRIFLDSIKSENQMITNVLYWDEKAEKISDLSKVININTSRNILIESFDIDNDKLIDIPTYVNLKNNSNIISWYKIDKNNGFHHLKYTAINDTVSFMIEIPSLWLNSVQVNWESDNNKMVFYKATNKETEKDIPLFSVIEFDPANDTIKIPENYILYMKNSKTGLEYYFNITDEGTKFDIKKESIKIILL